MDLRAGTVVLFITILIAGRHGIMENATTIYLTGYVRQSQARHETSHAEITLTGQCMCVCFFFFKVVSSCPTADNPFYPVRFQEKIAI